MNSLLQIIVALVLLVAPCIAGIPEDRQQVIVVVGSAGTPEYGELFSTWADRWVTAAGAGDVECTVIGQSDQLDDFRKLQESLAAACHVKTTEPMWLVLIGHGTFDGRVAHFNLRGKDVSAADLAEALTDVQRPIAVVNCASCSSPFINALSQPKRVIVSATKEGSEIQFARFGGFIAAAVGSLEADLNRDGQTSLLEAWLFAAARTAEYYAADGRLATEHSLLDDNGDQKGTRAELFEGVRIKQTVKDKTELDGKLAAQWHLVRSAEERLLSPEQRLQRTELEEKLEVLRERRSEFSETDYLDRLQQVLVPLAELYENASSETASPSAELQNVNN